MQTAPKPWSPDYRFRCRIADGAEFLVDAFDPGLAARLAYPVEELMGSGTWVKLTPPEDIGRLVEAFRPLLELRTVDARVRIRGRAGEIVILRVHAMPERLADGDIKVDVEARDVTEVARLEAAVAEARGRLRLLDDELAIAMWTTDDALRFTWSSGRLLGEENSLLGTSLYEFFPGDPDSAAIKAHEAALRGETTTYDVEWEDLNIRALLEPLRDELGRIAGVMGVGVDLRVLMRTARLSRPSPIVRAIHERVHPPHDVRGSGEKLHVAGLVIDAERFEVQKNDATIPLTVTEFKLLTELAHGSGAVLRRDELAERVWGHPFYGSDASLTMAISRLRDKIEDDPAHPKIVQTVRGIGYRLGE